jgi:hypothetical protein
MVPRSSNIESVEVVVDTDQRFKLELLEDMGKVASDTFKSRYSLVLTKTLARSIIKTAASGAAANVAGRSRGGALIGLATGIAGRAATELSEKADLRISRYFPEQAHVGGINLDPGTYSITVNYYGRGGALIGSEQIDNVQVETGRLNLVRSIAGTYPYLSPSTGGVREYQQASAMVAAQAARPTNAEPIGEPEETIPQETVIAATDYTPQSETLVESAGSYRPEQAAQSDFVQDNDTWKNKRVYLGGTLGMGNTTVDGHFYTYNEVYAVPLTAAGFVADFALMRYFSIESGFILGLGDGGAVPILPVLAKLGGRFAQAELSFNFGYSIGAGLTLGGTFGMHTGKGIMFAEFLGMPSSSWKDDDASVKMLFVGYKTGLGDKR